jgi:hypothetical protein
LSHIESIDQIKGDHTDYAHHHWERKLHEFPRNASLRKVFFVGHSIEEIK